MAEGSFIGAKVIGVILAIVGILLLLTGITSIVAVSIPGLPAEVLTALSSLSSNAYIQIVYGIIVLGVSAGLFKAEEWAAGAAGVLLILILVTTGFTIYSLVTTLGLSGLYSELTSLSMPVITNIATFVVALISVIYLAASRGWR
ncbi:MAG: hypothetical protein ACTSYQ_00005 [Candidatus Odinarchaeia archaeon]